MFVTAYTPSSPLFRCDVVRRVGLAIRAWTDAAYSILAGRFAAKMLKRE